MKLGKRVYVIVLSCFFFCLLQFGCQSVKKPLLDPSLRNEGSIIENDDNEKYKLEFQGSFFWGCYFVQGNNPDRYNLIEVDPVFIHSSPNANKYFKDTKANNMLTWIFASVGGFCMGYPIGHFLKSGYIADYDTYMLLGGVGSTLVSFVFADASTNSIKKATYEYNKSLGFE
ncbi:TPA: hypothetical protein ENS27_09720 [bacterium]|nr:hypothetical protein [bacterium]